MRDYRKALLLAASFCTMLPALAPVATAQEKPATATQRGSITITVGSGRVIHLTDNASNVFTADPKVAEVRPASPNSLFVFGVAPGSTTVAAMTSNGSAVGQYQIVVVPSGFDASMASAAIHHDEPRSSVRAKEMEAGVGLTGHVASPGDAERAVTDAKGVLPADGKVLNRLDVNESVQVSLHVRIAEMSRTLIRELGVNWSTASTLGSGVTVGSNGGLLGSGGTIGGNLVTTLADTAITPSSAGFVLGNLIKRGYDLSATIDALSQDQLVHTLAEPNLTAMSGESASFLVGGEFPIPVATEQNTISLNFKQYGISLAFVPTVVSHDRINLHVRPEVSALDKANGITSIIGLNQAVNIPALTVRRADTTVELGSGQSFVIAGLLSDQTTLTGNGVPGLADVPVLGALFRSDGFQRQQTELVIVVTPYIVRPINDPNAARLPTDGWHAPNDIERIIFLRQMGSGAGLSRPHIPADAGFMVE